MVQHDQSCLLNTQGNLHRIQPLFTLKMLESKKAQPPLGTVLRFLIFSYKFIIYKKSVSRINSYSLFTLAA